MSKKGCEYTLQDFIAACGSRGQARVLGSAKPTAASDLNLHTDDAILDWICSGGIEKPEFANCEPWEKNPNPSVLIWVDSYNFYSGRNYFYLAFMRQPTTLVWLVKSLKKNNVQGPRPFLLAGKLLKAGFAK